LHHRDRIADQGFKAANGLAAMFLRFVTTRIDNNSHRLQGVFVASHRLLDSGDLTPDEWKHVREILNWFNANLPTPPKSFTTGRAIFWFKSGAKESIRNIWELVHLLQRHEHYVEVHKCRRLGNILWEDKFQVAAFPSKLDGRITIQ
jgi:hypothetical protein